MAHAHHFLSRLDRVSTEHVELALSLYNDVPLLRYVLDVARIGDGVARVALALAHGEAPPYLVVTRGGHFVTCLGEGMSPGAWPVVSFSRLEAVMAKVEGLRERLALADRLGGDGGRRTMLLKRVYEAGDSLSREEFTALAAWQPILRNHWLASFWEISGRLDVLLAAAYLGGDRNQNRADERLHKLWKMVWSLAHLGALLAVEVRSHLDAIYDRCPSTFEDLGLRLTDMSISAFVMRGTHWAGKGGKHLLPAYKREYDRATSPTRVVTTTLGLMAIGLRHAKLRAEVRKTLATHPFGQEGASDRQFSTKHVRTLFEKLRVTLCDFVGALAPLIDGCFDEPESLSEQFLAAGRIWLTNLAPPKAARVAELAPESVQALLCRSLWGLYSGDSSLLLSFASLPWLARAQSEEFYAPAELLEEFPMPWSPKLAANMLTAMRTASGRHRPFVKSAEPGRNDPCECGSGKKYKKCCAMA